MKYNANKENFHLLNLKENYLNKLSFNENDIVNDFSNILVDYIIYATETLNLISLNNKSLSKYLIVRGLDTIIHVFSILLYYTKNLPLSLYHCQKSYYFYIEFVSQISQDDKSYLQLNSRDAVTYVYKKTIYEINYEIKIENSTDMELANKFKKINHLNDIIKLFIYKILETDDFNKDINIKISKLKDTNSILLYGNSNFSIDEIKKILMVTSKIYNDNIDYKIFNNKIVALLKLSIDNKNFLKKSEDFINDFIICQSK